MKGVVGMGLPTIAMGLLALKMPPLEAATLLLIPSFVTNAWQLATGPSLRNLWRRMWPMLTAIVIVTLASAGLIVGGHAHYRPGGARPLARDLCDAWSAQNPFQSATGA